MCNFKLHGSYSMSRSFQGIGSELFTRSQYQSDWCLDLQTKEMFAAIGIPAFESKTFLLHGVLASLLKQANSCWVKIVTSALLALIESLVSTLEDKGKINLFAAYVTTVVAVTWTWSFYVRCFLSFKGAQWPPVAPIQFINQQLYNQQLLTQVSFRIYSLVFTLELQQAYN